MPTSAGMTMPGKNEQIPISKISQFAAVEAINYRSEKKIFVSMKKSNKYLMLSN